MSNQGIPKLPVVTAPATELDAKTVAAIAPMETESNGHVSLYGLSGDNCKPLRKHYWRERPCPICAGNPEYGGKMLVQRTDGRTQYVKCNECGHTGKDTIPNFVGPEEIAKYDHVELIAVFHLSRQQVEQMGNGSLNASPVRLTTRPLDPLSTR